MHRVLSCGLRSTRDAGEGGVESASCGCVECGHGGVGCFNACAVGCAALPCPCSAKTTSNFCAIILPQSGRSCRCFLATRPATTNCAVFTLQGLCLRLGNFSCCCRLCFRRWRNAMLYFHRRPASASSKHLVGMSVLRACAAVDDCDDENRV